VRAALEQTFARAKGYAHDERHILVLRVDLTDPKNRLRAKDKTDGDFRVLPFDRDTLPRILEVVEKHEPWRAAATRKRYFEGARGFAAEYKGEIVGYVFYVEGTDTPHRQIHTDLHWLGLSPKRGELYAFDYFLIEPARGIGARFVRAVQDEHYRLGYTATYGWVLSTNRAALWLYRTTGWTEISRVIEHRLFARWVFVGDILYRMQAHSRTPLASLPSIARRFR
jgi:GNAT superfamily N-acetyltransferase